jgi:hypothetical protein
MTAIHPADEQDSHLPDLRFVPTESIIPHEQHDDQRLGPLVQRFREQSVLKNPPVVTPIWGGTSGARFMVLDGANRSTAARAAGFPHIVVQVVPYDHGAVRLSTWNHALADFPRAGLEEALGTISGLECRRAELLSARAALARRAALAWVQLADGPALTLHGGNDLHDRNALLNQIVDRYHRRKFYRVEGDDLGPIRLRHPDVTGLVVFPHFEPAEILELATAGDRLPAGITRHLIRWRALRLNIPIDKLQDDRCSLEDKNRWLEQWISEKLAVRQVRFYEEPTVLFDE